MAVVAQADVGLLPPSLGRASRVVVLTGLGLLLVTSLAGVGYLVARGRPAEVALHADTVVVGAGGQVLEARAAEVVPGTRVLAGTPDTERLVAEEAAWLVAGTVPEVAGVSRDLVVAGLLDLRVLSRTYGVPVAGWSPAWRHVWPRDSALAAAALARTGHPADAERIVAFLGRVQPASGVLAARYLADGQGEPDNRGIQLDGVGWTLWATAQVAQALPAADRADFVRRHARLLDRSAAAARGRSTTHVRCRRSRPTTGRYASDDPPCRPRRCWPPGSTRRPTCTRCWATRPRGRRRRTRPPGCGR